MVVSDIDTLPSKQSRRAPVISPCSVRTLATGFALFLLLKSTMGIRVTPEEEMAGLDISEHGIQAYGGDLVPGAGD